MGKCVSTAVKQAQTAQTQAITNAAATCKAARKADAAAFPAKYGGKKANAYGKCLCPQQDQVTTSASSRNWRRGRPPSVVSLFLSTRRPPSR